MRIDQLKPPDGAHKEERRVGRGIGSGSGKTAGRGHKGQKARSGGAVRPGFEGGQMPLVRRVPKRGFTNIFRREWAVVNVGDLNRFAEGAEITPEVLLASGVIKSAKDGVKVLGGGELDRALTVKVQAVSGAAREKITGAGGRVEVI